MDTEKDHALFFDEVPPEKYVMTDEEREAAKLEFNKLMDRLAEIGPPKRASKEDINAFAVPTRQAMKEYNKWIS